MSFFYPLPDEGLISEEFTPVDLDCPACGTHQVARYRALEATGWHVVERCRACFHYVSIEPARQSYVPLTDGWPTSDAG